MSNEIAIDAGLSAVARVEVARRQYETGIRPAAGVDEMKAFKNRLRKSPETVRLRDEFRDLTR